MPVASTLGLTAGTAFADIRITAGADFRNVKGWSVLLTPSHGSHSLPANHAAAIGPDRIAVEALDDRVLSRGGVASKPAGQPHLPASRFHRCNVFVLRPVTSETVANELASTAKTVCIR